MLTCDPTRQKTYMKTSTNNVSMPSKMEVIAWRIEFNRQSFDNIATMDIFVIHGEMTKYKYGGIYRVFIVCYHAHILLRGFV